VEPNLITSSILGGALIGLAVTFMLLFNGRVAGISGILSGLLVFPKKDTLWRLSFLIGMLAGGLILRASDLDVFKNTSGRPMLAIAIGGLFVGYGTVMGGGCTSGHGVCGMSRMSMRSILATIILLFSELCLQL
jgi:uncharacterized protein